MKLGKLLAASTSIMKGQMDISYRSSKQIYLPKFVSPKNPFQAQAEPQTAESAAETTGHADSQAASEEADAPRPTRVAPPETPVAAPIKTVASKTQKIPAVSSVPENKSTWAGKLGPKSIFKAVVSKTVGQPGPGTTDKVQKPLETQTELSLDTVRVVHNDLSDVDVEVVPMKSRSMPPENKPAKKSWEVLGERLFGVEAT
jgi:hypothetical protein